MSSMFGASSIFDCHEKSMGLGGIGGAIDALGKPRQIDTRSEEARSSDLV